MRLRDLPARAAVTAVLWAVGALFLIVECMAGCATLPQPIPMAQPVAADVAWACVGGSGPTPVVQVVPQTQLTCSNTDVVAHGFGCGRPGYPMTPSLPCVCVAGLEHGSPILIARTGPPVFPSLQPWHETALAHELYHRRLLQQGLDEDVLHKGIAWTTVVPSCNETLRNGGY